MVNAKAMRINVAARPPKMYGIGEFHRIPAEVDVLAGLISLSCVCDFSFAGAMKGGPMGYIYRWELYKGKALAYFFIIVFF